MPKTRYNAYYYAELPLANRKHRGLDDINFDLIVSEKSIYWANYGSTITNNHLMTTEEPSDADCSLPTQIETKLNPNSLATSARSEDHLDQPEDHYFVQVDNFRVPEDWGHDTQFHEYVTIRQNV